MYQAPFSRAEEGPGDEASVEEGWNVQPEHHHPSRKALPAHTSHVSTSISITTRKDFAAAKGETVDLLSYFLL